MAVQHGVPGEWAKVRGTVLSLWPLFLSFTALGAFAAATALGTRQGLFGALFTGAAVVTAVLWRNGVRRVQSFFKGARGEERTAGILAALPDTWHVFHDFAVGPQVVDHVVVGPAGVFCVETKAWQGQVTVEEGEVLVNGRLPSRSPVRQTMREAQAVRRALAALGCTAEPVPVVCFASDTFADGGAQVGGARLINARALVAWLLEAPARLAPDDLKRFVTLIETRG